MLQNYLKESATQLAIFANVSQNWYRAQYPQQMVQMAFCDLSHRFHKQVTNVSHHVFVILGLLWGILTSSLLKL